MRSAAPEAVARLFLARQHLDRPFARPLSAASLERFASDVGGVQLDSINVVARGHELTLWSRFGPYAPDALERLVYGERAAFEYWAHAACLVAASDLPAWSRAMADYRRRLRKTLRALGAAAEADLPRYLTFPRFAPGERRRALKTLLKSGEAVALTVEGLKGRWYALADDLPALAAPPEPRGTTLLSPFDSLLWHRGRAKALFGFDYRIEVYTPAPKRVHGYYALPVLHEGRLIGRVDLKTHRGERRLEVRRAGFEAPLDAASAAGTASALRSLARFVGAERVDAPPGPLADALAVL
ncbi:MAG: YcaQ family DNA glycosylase [Elusimicrobia bacterium]|nr:YcaQ family DNA glycosylase [Elusimicrobiota bacterium]